MNVIAFEHATIHIGGRTVLSDVSFAIQPRRIHRRARTKRRRQDHVDARHPRSAAAERWPRGAFSGATPNAANPAIGYLPQLRTVLPDLRVRGRDFIASSLNGERWGLPSLAARNAKQSKPRSTPSARAISPRAPLSEMSGGERQRLLLAQALIGSPKLLLLDEPLISLDARHQEIAIDVVRKVCRERKITVLVQCPRA